MKTRLPVWLLLAAGLTASAQASERNVWPFWVGHEEPTSGQIASSQALGPRDRLLLVQVGGEQILLGISAGRITPLHVLKEPVPVAATEAAPPEFAQRLMELLGKDQKDGKS